MMEKKTKKMVCVDCGHEVSKCGENSICSIFGHGKDMYFCGFCTDEGSHVDAIEAEKWKKARKILGLSTKINDYSLSLLEKE